MYPSFSHGVALRLIQTLVSGGLWASACSAPDQPAPGAESGAPNPTDVVDTALELLAPPDDHPGKALFEKAPPGTNGRSCATCHVIDEATTLRPDSVAARLADDPADPLFNRIDADDPGAEIPTFEHLKKGLVRVVLSLADNMDVIDEGGNVVTSPERTLVVWRGVPSVANVALTAPYQADGREATLESQAQSALGSHAEGPRAPARALGLVADFERENFSSPRARWVSRLLDAGLPLEEIPVPEDFMPLSSTEKRGREVHERACQPCHGSASTDRIIDREVHDLFFAELGPDGNVLFDVVDGQAPVAVPRARPDDEFLNVGFGYASYLGQIGVAPAFNDDVELPRYRFRFYSDGSRSRRVVDLPPAPVTQSGNPLDPRSTLDERGAPIVGPNRAPQLFSTDPGRAAISGDPADFEAFDVPQLRGIAATAPYFHDNSHGTLEDVIDAYSRFILSAIPPMALPAANPPEATGLPKESLSVQQKHDLLAFLRRL